MSEFLREGGVGMIPTMILGFLLIASGVLSLVRPERRSLEGFVPLAVATGAAGLLGTVLGMISCYRYLGRLQVVDRLEIALVGTEESLHCLVVALVLIIIGAVLAWAASLRKLPSAAAQTVRADVI